MPEENEQPKQENGPSLFDNNFTPQDARSTLEEQTGTQEKPIVADKENLPAKKSSSPITWLVGVLIVLGVIVLAVWLAA